MQIIKKLLFVICFLVEIKKVFDNFNEELEYYIKYLYLNDFKGSVNCLRKFKKDN